MAKSNSTISIGFKIEEGADGMKTLIMDASALRDVMKATVEESKQLQGHLVNFASIATGIDSMASYFSSLQSEVNDLTGAYGVQAEVETQLEHVMRNTMDATQQQIQSIKDFCSAQQQIGIIGDEVQLAGAQELATYLEMKSSLQSLIPVMNDMLAQQYGFAATGENAAQIASMLGKVMEGQTGALSRYGYKFDEAQEKILKYGTESERVAVLVDVVKESVGGMNQALAQTPSGYMKQLENSLGDVKEELGAIATRVQPVLAIGANAVTATSGVLKLTQGLKALTITLGLTKKAAGWIGLAITAVVAGLTWLYTRTNDASDALARLKTAEQKAAEEAQRAKDVVDTQTDARKAATASINLNIARLENFNGTKAEEQKLVKEMNATYGETMGYFKSVAEWYKALKSNSEAYCDQLVAEAKARKYADQIADLEIHRDAIAFDKENNKIMYSTKQQEEYRSISDEEAKDLRAKGKRVDGQRVAGKYVHYAWMPMEGTSEHEQAQAAYNTLTRQRDALKKKREAELSKASKIKMPEMGSATPPEDFKPAATTKIQKELAPDGSIQKVKEQISDIEKKITFAIDPDEVFRLQKEKMNLQDQLRDLELPIRLATNGEKIQEMIGKIEPLDIPVKVDTESLTQELGEIPKTLSATEKLSKALGGMSDVASAAGQAFRGMGQAFEMPELDVMGIIAGSIATLLQGFASASAQNWALGPFGWAAFTLTGFAQVMSMISQIKSVSAFADGGVVYGPTLGLVGEYAGASSNPEVIAPLNKLRDIIGDTPGNAPVIIGGKIRISGRQLDLILENQSKVAGISGRKSNR